MNTQTHDFAQIRNVGADGLPMNRHGRHTGQWVTLRDEVLLRLERTPSDWLLVGMPDEDTAKRARAALLKYVPGGQIQTSIQPLTDLDRAKLRMSATSKWAIAVRRGPNWGKHEA